MYGSLRWYGFVPSLGPRFTPAYHDNCLRSIGCWTDWCYDMTDQQQILWTND